jgi:hypothetical protein
MAETHPAARRAQVIGILVGEDTELHHLISENRKVFCISPEDGVSWPITVCSKDRMAPPTGREGHRWRRNARGRTHYLEHTTVYDKELVRGKILPDRELESASGGHLLPNLISLLVRFEQNIISID